MDCVVVETVRNPSSKPESRAVLTRPGTRFGRLVVERRDALGYVVMRCDCGETVALTGRQVQAGKRYQCDSCDTWDRKPLIKKYLGDDIYRSIRQRGHNALRRCEDPSAQSYKNYGGRGIRFDYQDLDHYTLHVGMLAQFHGLDKQADRKNNDGPYSPENTLLVSVSENIRNRRNTFMIDGVPLAKIAEDNGMDPVNDKSRYSSLMTRLRDLICIRKITVQEAAALVNEFKVKQQNEKLRAKSPQKKLTIDGVPLTDFIARMGFPKNRALYSAAKDYLRNFRRKDQVPSGEQLRDHLVMYAIKRDIKSTPR